MLSGSRKTYFVFDQFLFSWPVNCRPIIKKLLLPITLGKTKDKKKMVIDQLMSGNVKKYIFKKSLVFARESLINKIPRFLNSSTRANVSSLTWREYLALFWEGTVALDFEVLIFISHFTLGSETLKSVSGLRWMLPREHYLLQITGMFPLPYIIIILKVLP